MAGYYVVPPPSPAPCNAQVCTYTAVPPTFAKGVFKTWMDGQATIFAANSTGFRPYDSLGSSLPANYTLVVGDEWGQIELLHFAVVPSSNLPVVGSFLSASGGCAENASPVPCVTSLFSDAFIFDCATQAATASGCTTNVSAGIGNAPSRTAPFTITVWYPYLNQPGEPAYDNCKFSVPGDTVNTFGQCFVVNATAFAMSY